MSKTESEIEGEKAGAAVGRNVKKNIEMARLTAKDVTDYTASFIRSFHEELKKKK